jgi:ABC-type spermidine/putrescine transport system permease subunit I
VGDISERVGDLHGKVDRVIGDEPFWVKALRRVGLAALVIGVVGGLIAFIIIMVVDFDVDVFRYTREFGLNAFTKFLIALGVFLGSVTTGALAAAASMVLANIADDLDALRKK